MAPRILIFSITLGANYSFYVKSIATCTPTFFGYIISVLASVRQASTCDYTVVYRYVWVLLLYHYIYSFSERRPLAPTCFREVFYICMSKSIFHWSHRENLTVASIDKRSRKNFCTLIIFPLYQIKAFIPHWHFLGILFSKTALLLFKEFCTFHAEKPRKVWI